MLAVVVQHRVVEGINALEIFCVKNVLRAGPGDRNQCFTGGVRHQVKMKITGLGHLYINQIACGYYGRRPCPGLTSKPSLMMSSISIHITAPGTPIGRRCSRDAVMWILAWGRAWIT